MSLKPMWAVTILAIAALSVNSSAQLEDKRSVLIVPRVVSVEGSGLVMTGKALQSIDARRAHVGDRVEFELVYDILQKDGRVAIPKGAHILATVTEAISRNEEQPESRLSLKLERANWDNGTVLLRGGVAGILQVPATLVQHNTERHPETSEFPDLKNIAQGIQYFPVHPWEQREISPGQMPIGYQEGRDVLETPPIASDRRFLAMEDVSLRRDPKGVSLVSTKKNVKIEKWTFMLLRTETLE